MASFYRFKVPFGPQLGSNLAAKIALELPKSAPRGAYGLPEKTLGARTRQKAAQNPPKPPQGDAQTLSKPRFWTNFGKHVLKMFDHFSNLWTLDFE